ncbi:MAG: STAS domain-containing protein [Solirubrobacterales bacterium]
MQPAPFETSSAEVDGVRIVAVRGELDLSTAPDLQGPLDAALDDGRASVLIDLSECEFIDSTGIALIVRAWQRLGGDGNSGPGGRLVICTDRDQVRRVLDVSGLDQSIPVHASREDGLAALRE